MNPFEDYIGYCLPPPKPVSHHLSPIIMSRSQLSEMRVLLQPEKAELVRAFVRESSLSEGVSPGVSGLIAEETARTWTVLCTVLSAEEYLRLYVLSSRNEISSRILLSQSCEFSVLTQTLKAGWRPGRGISWRESGTRCQVYFHRPLTDPPPKIMAAKRPLLSPVQRGLPEYISEPPQRR